MQQTIEELIKILQRILKPGFIPLNTPIVFKWGEAYFTVKHPVLKQLLDTEIFSIEFELELGDFDECTEEDLTYKDKEKS